MPTMVGRYISQLQQRWSDHPWQQGVIALANRVAPGTGFGLQKIFNSQNNKAGAAMGDRGAAMTRAASDALNSRIFRSASFTTDHGPWTNGYSGEPSPQGTVNGAVADGGFAINKDGSYAVPDYFGDSDGRESGNRGGGNGQSFLGPLMGSTGASTGGGHGSGWRGTTDVGGTMAALNFFGGIGTSAEGLGMGNYQKRFRPSPD